MTDEVRALLDEYTARFRAGEHPDPVAYLDRAGPDGDELMAAIDAFLATAPPPEPDDALVAVMDAWQRGEPPVLALRTVKGVTRAEVVAALMADLDIAPAKQSKVARYFQRLESGLLNTRRVDGRVFASLARALGASISDLLFPPLAPTTTSALAAPSAAGGAYLRSAADAEEAFEVDLSALHDGGERDEVDELFEGAE